MTTRFLRQSARAADLPCTFSFRGLFLRSFFNRVVCALLLGFCSRAAIAQKDNSVSNAVVPSRVDIYAGYGYLLPGHSGVGDYLYGAVGNLNATASVTAYFTRHFGVAVEGGYFSGNSPRGIQDQCTPACSSRDQLYYTAEAGPVYRMPLGRFTPSVHLLGGGSRVNGPYNQPLVWGPGMKAGGGVDWVPPILHNHLAIRIAQADFQYSRQDYGPLVDGGKEGGIGEIYAFKLSSGLVLRLGSIAAPTALVARCSVQPESVFPGEPVTATINTGGVDGRKHMTTTWSASGGIVKDVHGDAANVDTSNLAAGTYALKAHIAEGHKAREVSDCTASFTVRAYDPPTLSCSSDPGSVASGTPSAIVAVGSSPQNLPLTYSFTSAQGVLSGAGATVSLATTGVAPGTVAIQCHVRDNRGNAADASTTVTIVRVAETAASMPVKESPETLCAATFARDAKRPARVNNEAKACLDDVALNLQRDAATRLVLIGRQTSREPAGTAAARATHVKRYLVADRGIEASRIDLQVGDEEGQAVDDVLLPAGATLPDAGSHAVSAVPEAPAGRSESHR